MKGVATYIQKNYLSSSEQHEILDINGLFGGSPSPSNRTSRPPILLKWFCPLGFSESAE